MKQERRLAAVLNALLLAEGDRVAAAETLASQLPTSHVLVVVAWDVAALSSHDIESLDLSRAPEITAFDRRNRQILAATLVEKGLSSQHQLLLDYPDLPYSVMLVSSVFPISPGIVYHHSFSSVLLAMHLIRDSDASVILPRQRREERLQELAAASDLEVEHFRSLALSYRLVREFAE